MKANCEDREISEDPEKPAGQMSDLTLWRRCQATDMPENIENELLDLAAFADGSLDPDEHDRVAASLAGDLAAAADVAAACVLAAGFDATSPAIERIIARASALRPTSNQGQGVAIPFPLRPRRPVFRGVAQWGSLAAAIAMVAWLGFAVGSDTSLALSQPSRGGNNNAVAEWFDPAIGFLPDLGADAQS
jgi:anti-sigma factor RsiW